MTPRFALIRVAVRPDGAYGVLLHDGLPFALTLERTYDAQPAPCCHEAAPGQWVKLPPGRYRCVRSMYWKGRYPTFEIVVPGHTRVLFHKGNVEADVEGCVLVGERFEALRGDPGILDSAAGFGEFMRRAQYVEAFDLDVKDPPAGAA